MRISAVIPSRGRPALLVGCVHTYIRLLSLKHQVTLVLAVDIDDSPTVANAFDLKTIFPNVAVRVSDRRPALGSYYNEACAAHPADVYCAIGDDTLCMAQNWDDAIAQSAVADPSGLWWWSCEGDRQAIYPIMTDGWYKAQGRFFTDLFPFWFDDVWLREVAVMVTGQEVPRIAGAKLIDTVTRTTRMRDLKYWDDFYQKTRPGRVAEARKIAKALGRDDSRINAIAASFAPNTTFQDQANEIENLQGDEAPVTPEYLQAKERARVVLARIAMLHVQAA